jgi:hypothetical protein
LDVQTDLTILVGVLVFIPRHAINPVKTAQKFWKIKSFTEGRPNGHCVREMCLFFTALDGLFPQ